MAESLTCRTCGIEFPSDTPMGQCPKCLFDLGVAAADEPAPTRDRRCFAGYELVRQIGCGGMGVVYEARPPRLNRTVALKMILGGESCSPVIRRRFFIEAEAAARLDHPNIVPIYEVGEFEDQPFLTMKLIPGESLRKKMIRGELGLAKDGESPNKSAMADRERTIARLIATLARAVHHAHTHNVVHRDLKPGNILFDANNTPYVTDFGLAKILDPDHSGPSARTEVIGTLSYMSPQQIRADAVSPATDIYSLGVILYELLAGQAPFHGATRNETLRLIETQPPTRLQHRNKNIHKDLETICLKCLEKDSGNRYASAEALAEDLERWLANQPIKARPAGLFLRTGRWIRRNPQGTALILSLTLALLAAIGFFIQLSKKMEMEKLRSASLYEHWGQRVREMLRDPKLTNIVIGAGEIANLRGRLLPNSTDQVKPLTLAVNIEQDPIRQTTTNAPLLENLQETMGAPSPPVGWSRLTGWITSWFSRRPTWQLGQPVVFDLKLCRNSKLAFNEIANGGADFQRLGAVSYLRAQSLNPKVEAVVQESEGKKAVIFVPSNSPITQLSQFAGRSFAFGDTNSTIVAWAKYYLVQAGVWGTNRCFYETIDDDVPVSAGEPGYADGSTGARNSPVYASGWAAANEMVRGSQFMTNDFPGLSNLVQRLGSGSDPVSRFLWSQFPPETQNALTNAEAKPETLQRALADGLNRVLRDKSIFEPQRFARVSLSEETRRLLAQNPQGDDLIRLNRLLLQDAYPLAIEKRRQIDGAVLQKPWFVELKKREPGLREVYSFTSTPNVWVARADLNPAVVRAFKEAMLSIKGPALLTALPTKIKPSFRTPDKKAFDDLRAILTNEVAEFEGTRSAPPPAVREGRAPAP
jgi:serine/threonine protein kinase